MPLLGFVTKPEHGMAATGIEGDTLGTLDPGSWGKLKEGAVACPALR